MQISPPDSLSFPPKHPGHARSEAHLSADQNSEPLTWQKLPFNVSKLQKSHPDNFTEAELETVGLGYDRMVRFMEKDDPDLHTGSVTVREPICSRFSDERVTIYGEVKDHEEWQRIEQHEMAVDFGKRSKAMDDGVEFRYFWEFVRHPRWGVN